NRFGLITTKLKRLNAVGSQVHGRPLASNHVRKHLRPLARMNRNARYDRAPSDWRNLRCQINSCRVSANLVIMNTRSCGYDAVMQSDFGGRLDKIFVGILEVCREASLWHKCCAVRRYFHECDAAVGRS